jgi:hypothetical protein
VSGLADKGKRKIRLTRTLSVSSVTAGFGEIDASTRYMRVGGEIDIVMLQTSEVFRRCGID